MENNHRNHNHLKKSHNAKEGVVSIRALFLQALPTIVSVIIGICFFFLIYRFDKAAAVLATIYKAIKPVVLGLAIAFLISPIVNFFERVLTKVFIKANAVKRNSKRAKGTVRGISILLALLLVLTVFLLLAMLVIPEFVASMQGLINDLPGYVDITVKKANEFMSNKQQLSEVLLPLVEDITRFIDQWLYTGLSEKVSALATALATGLLGFIGVAYNLIIGIIISVYLLAGKERFLGEAKKLTFAVCSSNKAERLIENMRRINEIFSGAILGKILGSAIIGVICFIFCSLSGIFFVGIKKYTLVVSVIIAVTNVIPFFGPYIGGIPSVLLILLVSPIEGLIFGVFIICLQQFDCNFLNPKIVGEKVGLPSFWVLFACIVGGSLFGLMGVLLSVPIFAVLYYLVKSYFEERLHKKQLPIDTENYIDM